MNLEKETFPEEQPHYQKILLQAATGMVREHNLERLLKLIVCIIKKTVNIDFVAIFLQDKENKIYKLKATRGKKLENLNFSYQDEFIKYLRKNTEPVFFEDLPPYLKNILSSLKVELIVPSFMENVLLGFLFLGEKLNKKPYTQDDINIFKILSHQASLAIENCLFFEEFKKAQERIFIAEKLASVGGMADGIAHQIKNRLNHFSIAIGELKFEIEDFINSHKEFVEKNPHLKKTFDYLLYIANSLDKNVKMTNGIIRGILDFARIEEKDTFFSWFSFFRRKVK
jgi:transcriptional regulator with GAF, ATPase, and Fis domain